MQEKFGSRFFVHPIADLIDLILVHGAVIEENIRAMKTDVEQFPVFIYRITKGKRQAGQHVFSESIVRIRCWHSENLFSTVQSEQFFLFIITDKCKMCQRFL